MTRHSTDPDVRSATAAAARPRIVIDAVSPCVDGGRFPARAVVDRPQTVGADIFMDGHDRMRGELCWRHADDVDWQHAPMRPLGNDRWSACFVPRCTGLHLYRIRAWFDRWATFCNELSKKYAAGVPIAVELHEGELLMRQAADADHAVAEALLALLAGFEGRDEAQIVAAMLDDRTAEWMHHLDRRPFEVTSDTLPIDVERVAAGFSAWYELFPRSQSPTPGAHGTFDDVIARLPAIHAMGFDVLYFPPIHPIGRTHRKGRNNSLHAGPDDPGSPYAIGSEDGGHDALHPQLGDFAAFERLRAAAASYGIELALDFAIQCSPDHPWLAQHPGWFAWRPDGSLRYAENPPKKYEDIVNVDFHADAAIPSLWLAWRDVVRFWIDRGVSIFRVDNPHTKPLPFWQWLIADIRSRHPQAIFLSEAFTRPAMMYRLAKIGFSQSYTYFIWRNTRQELTAYLTELAHGPPRDFFRPHFFVNTPDINPYFLQTSGRAGFMIRAALAATLSGLWGMYSGFELCEHAAVPGREEYLDSEKYELRQRDWTAPGNIIGVITRLNHIRRENPALQTHLGVHFHDAGNDEVLFFSKTTDDLGNLLLVAISLDPRNGQDGSLALPRGTLGHADDAPLEVEELMRGQRFVWSGRRQHWYFDPQELPFAVFRVAPAAPTHGAPA